MIEILQEVTDWGSASVFNGIYHVDDTGRLVAYQSEHELKTFKNPLKGFDKRGRKLEKVGIIDEPTASNVIIVKGSKGNEYKIIDGQCSCPGFVYRNDCKHIKELV